MNPLWRKIQRTNFTRLDDLSAYLNLSLTPTRFPLNLPRRLAAKIEKGNPLDPIFLQFVPQPSELLSIPGFTSEPVCDTDFQKEPKLLHKYANRALLVTTSACAMHCRYCFRQNFPYAPTTGFTQELSYLRNNPISEVILSGGDPLSLSDSTLSALLTSLDAIPHITRIRFHTRFPIGIPERIDESLLTILSSLSKQLIFVVHINHPRELDPDVLASLKKLQSLGPVLNQAVLLRNINDDETTLLTLCETLANNGILPYYLHALDPVSGAAHFSVPDSRGLELIAHLQKHLSGYAVPKFVREIPGEPSKTPLASYEQRITVTCN